MTISNTDLTEVYVWIWLPGKPEPVVAGKCNLQGNLMAFNYGQSYLKRDDAISIYDQELPLESGVHRPLAGLSLLGCIRDSAPDAWGRRVIINKLLGAGSKNVDPIQFSEITYLLESGSDRIGALDFQRSPTEYVARETKNATLDELSHSAERVEKGIPLTSAFDQALHHGSSIGGARPKALIDESSKKFIAKFSSQSDLYNICKAEFVAMRLAKLVGLNAANVQLNQSSHKDVLLVERFDREPVGELHSRRIVLSALTLLGLDEMMARYASYQSFAEIIRQRFVDPKETLTELFGRLIFNILCGNTDDHARNQACFWDGRHLSLAPAYDICPQSRVGGESTQAMLIIGDNRLSKISLCLQAAHQFLLTVEEAEKMVMHQLSTIDANWSLVCDEAELSIIDRQFLWGRQFLNSSVFDDLGKTDATIMLAANDIRQRHQ